VIAEFAFQMTGPNYAGIYSFYDDTAMDRQQLNWVSSAVRAIEPYTVGSYISEVDLSADAAIARDRYSAATWQRLQVLRAQYDPRNLFFGFA
jgi:FAD/FMN-containing dehydrogenase